ncbi:DUF2637 domain-containing protein [Phaeacidiphilus oryzae]|uniref:DUF2637 domain-containing protein n=1 Tax=Phaeacidiphilus oryzae TaxID=348818 RepID=UPI0005657FE3|nr:DUF2637 domain-containing protein [Phaeacidiphilus oryzae]
MTRAHRVLIGAVSVGAVLIAGIGFAGSYSAVRDLALHKGFGVFSYVFPLGVDVGIAALLALDLVLTWLRIPFPLLRQAAWLLTAGTIVFNAAASYPDPLGMGMHAIIPVLFVVVVEAARHAIGRIADITADRHMESVRLMRWLLAPLPTFRLWRRMKLWELRSYEEAVRQEQARLVYRTRLRARYGRAWRRTAEVEELLPLKLSRYGVPVPVLPTAEPAAVPAAQPAAEPRDAVPGPAPTPEAPTPTPAPEPVEAPIPAPVPMEPVAVEPEPAQELPVVRSMNGDRRPLTVPIPEQAAVDRRPRPEPEPEPEPEPQPQPEPEPVEPARQNPVDVYFEGLLSYIDTYGSQPNRHLLARHLYDEYGVTGRQGDGPIEAETLRRYWPELEARYLATRA